MNEHRSSNEVSKVKNLTASSLRWGDRCPACGEDYLDYNGLLQLECPRCGYEVPTIAACTC